MSQFSKKVNSILFKLKAGDASQQKVLFDTTYRHLKSVAYRYAADKNDCEDILLEAYLRAFQYIKSFDWTKDGYNWLCKIVQNTAADFNRNRFRCDCMRDIEKSGTESFENSVAEKDMVWRELEKLSEEDREILLLRFWENCTIKEISARISRSSSWVHRRISKIIQKILKNF